MAKTHLDQCLQSFTFSPQQRVMAWRKLSELDVDLHGGTMSQEGMEVAFGYMEEIHEGFGQLLGVAVLEEGESEIVSDWIERYATPQP